MSVTSSFPQYTDLNRFSDWVALDLETSGLSPLTCGVCEIAAIRFSRITGAEIDRFQVLCHPGCEIPPDVEEIHHISNDMVKNCISQTEAVAQLVRYLNTRSSLAFAHYAQFDAKFLNMLIRKAGLSTSFHLFCTYQWAKKTFAGLRSYGLDSLIYNLPLQLPNPVRVHRALEDCELVRQLAMRLGRGTELPKEHYSYYIGQ
jgi:DNA polymerase III epsilon subunit-like protein